MKYKQNPAYMKKTIIINAKNKKFGRLINFILKIININKIKIKKYNYKVIIMNIKYIKHTGNKLKKKIYYRHSGFPGGLKKTNLDNYFKKNKKNLIIKSLKNGVGKNRLFINLIKNINFILNFNNYINKIKPKIINNDLIL